jgi:O-antigen/teichoic acid export membrane protein
MHRKVDNVLNHISKKFRVDAHYFFKGGFWLTVDQGLAVIFGIVSTALFAKYLSLTDYGIYRYLLGLAALLASFSLTGIGQSILQTAAKKYYGFYRETIRINFIYSGGIALAGIAGALYYWFNSNPILALGCLLIGLIQPFINTFQYVPSFLQGDKRFQESTIIQSVKTITTSVSSILALFLTKNILILLCVYLASNALVNILSHLWYRPKNIIATPADIFNQYVSYAKQTSIRNVISSVAFRVDTIFIFTQLGAAELAIYSIATLIPEQIKGTFKNLANLLLPKYASHGNERILMASVPKRSKELFIILLSITVAYIIVSPYVFSFFFPKYADTVLYTQIYALSFPSFITLIPLTIIQSNLNEKALHQINNQNTIVGIVLIVILATWYGVMGAVVARILTRYINLIYIYSKFFKISK